MKLVYIEWIDAHGVSANWEWLKDLRNHAASSCHAKSVGFVIAENKDNIVLLPHLIEETTSTRGQGCGDMTIPKGCIKRMVVLHPTRKAPGRHRPAPRRRDYTLPGVRDYLKTWRRDGVQAVVDERTPKPQGSV